MSGSRRPALVGFMSILMIIVGVLQVGTGIVVLLGRNNKEIQDALDATSSETLTISIVMLIIGAIGILVGASLRSGQNWARMLVGIVCLANVFSLVWAAISYHRLHWYNVAWPTLVYSLILGYLFFDDDAKEYFGDE